MNKKNMTTLVRNLYHDKIRKILQDLTAIYAEVNTAQLASLMAERPATTNKTRATLQQQSKRVRMTGKTELEAIMMKKRLFREIVENVMDLQKNIAQLNDAEFYARLGGIAYYIDHLEDYLAHRDAANENLVMMKHFASPGDIFSEGYVKLAGKIWKDRIVKDAAHITKTTVGAAKRATSAIGGAASATASAAKTTMGVARRATTAIGGAAYAVSKSAKNLKKRYFDDAFKSSPATQVVVARRSPKKARVGSKEGEKIVKSIIQDMLKRVQKS